MRNILVFLHVLLKHPLQVMFGGIIFCFISIVAITVITFHQFFPLIFQLPRILGFSGTQKYLILFQNNMELRPGGGFIGSYATVSMDHGKFESFSVHNAYDTDGQLRKHIEPTFIVRRYLQANLYMRDSNFDVDFVKSAQKIASMYTLETGKKVDGVVALDLSYIQSLIALVSPLYIWQYNQTVTPSNFFLVTEKYVDKNSFAGSTQKQDFLKSLAGSMIAKIRENKVIFVAHAIEKTLAAISQKHLLFFSQDPKIQAILGKNKFSSTLLDERKNTSNTVNDFLGINEANIGVNKANYFLKRRIDHQVVLQKSGTIQENLKITYTNTSPNVSWPTGKYIAYVRIILPKNTNLASISFDHKKQKIVRAVTDPRIFGKPDFTSPGGLEVDRTDEEGKTLYGFIIIVDIHKSLMVNVAYTLSEAIQSPQISYDLIYFKQPGTLADPIHFSFIYPSHYRISSSSSSKGLVSHYMYTLSTKQLTDRHIVIRLSKPR